MLWTVVALYVRVLFLSFVGKALLSLMPFDFSSPFSTLYLRFVSWLQSFYPDVYPRSTYPYPAIREKPPEGEFVRDVDSSCHFEFLAANDFDRVTVWDVTSLSLQAGLNAIVQDDLSPSFDRAPTYGESLLRFSALPHWSPSLKVLFYFTLAFRLLYLLPLRVCFFLASFIFIALAVVYSFFTEPSERERSFISVIYSRLFCLGTGVIINSHNKQHMPRKPGIAVANHLSPNDVQILFADLSYDALQYIVTGQKHKGIIGVIEKMVSRLCRTLWFERGSVNERLNFLTSVIKISKEDGPILLFPEGYCTNNTSVLQFRKALFEADLNIYPIAISQIGVFGDNYWFEDKFHMYLLRLFSSWAVVYDIHYLPMMRRLKGENNQQFAQRTASEISRAAGLAQGKFSGALWYNASDRRKMQTAEKKLLAQRLMPPLLSTSTALHDPTPPFTATSTSTSAFVCLTPSSDIPQSPPRVLLSVQ